MPAVDHAIGDAETVIQQRMKIRQSTQVDDRSHLALETIADEMTRLHAEVRTLRYLFATYAVRPQYQHIAQLHPKMPIQEHPHQGTILICDFDAAFKEPEMVKPRCVVVLSPKIVSRAGLCTVVCLSTTAPEPVMQYHRQIDIRPKLPPKWESDGVWVKGDMVYSIGFHRLDLIRLGKDRTGKRIYRFDVFPEDQMKVIKSCVLRGLGMAVLTKHL